MNSLRGLKSIRTETETQEKQCEFVLITTCLQQLKVAPYSFKLSTHWGTSQRDLLWGPVPYCVLVFYIEILVAGTTFLIPATSPTN